MNLQELFKLAENDKELQKGLITSVINNAIEDGINPKNFSDKDKYKEKLQEYVRGIKLLEVTITADYRNSILQEARRYKRLKQYEFACVFYATWLEHWINKLLITYIRKTKFPKSEIPNLIKSYSFREKFLWFPLLLGLRPISIKHLNRIINLADIRNSFIHYKWPERSPHDTQHNKEVVDIMNNITTIIYYLKNYDPIIKKKGITKGKK
jgi:hypothetical protein